MMPPCHHPDEGLLLDYASGHLAEPIALIVATHLALCPRCRSQVATFEALGGALLEEAPPEPVSADCLKSLFARLDDPRCGAAETPSDNGADDARSATITVPAGFAAAVGGADTDTIMVPQPLRSYLEAPLARLDWHSVYPGIDEVRLDAGGQGPFTTRLLRLRGGTKTPRHSHRGTEMTLVLNGAYLDELGRFARGDFVGYDGTVDHRPHAESGGDCLCLTVTDAPLRLTGRIGRLLDPFIHF